MIKKKRKHQLPISEIRKKERKENKRERKRKRKKEEGREGGRKRKGTHRVTVLRTGKGLRMIKG